MFKNKKIIVTGGAGFVGTNLIKLLLKKTNFKILSIDNYSSGTIRNHIKDRRVKYLKGNTLNISRLIKYPKEIKTVFHFGEFARIYQSFIQMNECIESNSVGSNAVFNCFIWETGALAKVLKLKVKISIAINFLKIIFPPIWFDRCFISEPGDNDKKFQDMQHYII